MTEYQLFALIFGGALALAALLSFAWILEEAGILADIADWFAYRRHCRALAQRATKRGARLSRFRRRARLFR